MKVSGDGSYYAGFYSQKSVQLKDGGFDYTITNFSKSAEGVEYGRKGFHLPSRINWSTAKNVHETSGFDKKGNPVAIRKYIIIPFSHFAPFGLGKTILPGSTNSVPLHQFKQQIPSSLMPFVNLLKGRTHLTNKVINEFYKRQTFRTKEFKYSTSKIRMARIVNLGPGVTATNPAWKYSGWAGMQQAKYRRKGNRWAGSGHITFRTLFEDSEGWNIPQVLAKRVMTQATREVKPIIHEMVKIAVLEDLMFSLRITSDNG